MANFPIYFIVKRDGTLAHYGDLPPPKPVQGAYVILDRETAEKVWFRITQFTKIEAYTKGSKWYAYLDIDGRLNLLDEFKSRAKAEGIMKLTDKQAIALVDSAQMKHWDTIFVDGFATELKHWKKVNGIDPTEQVVFTLRGRTIRAD